MKPRPTKQRVAAHKKRKARGKRVHAQASALASAYRRPRRGEFWGIFGGYQGPKRDH